MNSEPIKPLETLAHGCNVLDPILQAHGFRLVPGPVGVGSGGSFASCSYVRDTRLLELHFRYSLGMVTYHIGEASLDHETLMRMLGVRDKSSFPDFTKEPLDSFRNLARDIENYCSDFLSGNGDQFRDLWLKSKNEKRGLAEVP